MKKKIFIPACVLAAAAIGFVIYALGHPELSLSERGAINVRCCKNSFSGAKAKARFMPSRAAAHFTWRSHISRLKGISQIP